MSNQQPEQLRAATNRRSERARVFAMNTVTEMAANNERITFKGVSARSGVSRSWLYADPAVRKLIEELRTHCGGRTPATLSAPTVSSLYQRVAALTEENRRLRGEVDGMREVIKAQLVTRRTAS